MSEREEEISCGRMLRICRSEINEHKKPRLIDANTSAQHEGADAAI
jgi:hypothetical protein